MQVFKGQQGQHRQLAALREGRHCRNIDSAFFLRILVQKPWRSFSPPPFAPRLQSCQLMFSKTNPYDEIVGTYVNVHSYAIETMLSLMCLAAATDENLTSENWELILGVCDKVSRSPPDR